MRSFQTAIVIEISTSLEDEFFREGYSQDYYESRVADIVYTDVHNALSKMREEHDKHSKHTVVSHAVSEVPNGIRRRSALFSTMLKSCFSAAQLWNRHGRHVWITQFSKKSDADFVRNNRHMIVDILDNNGMDSTAGFRFPEVDEARAEDVWRRVNQELEGTYDKMWNEAYRKAVLDTFDADYEDGLINRIRQTSVDSVVDSIDGIMAARTSSEPF